MPTAPGASCAGTWVPTRRPGIASAFSRARSAIRARGWSGSHRAGCGRATSRIAPHDVHPTWEHAFALYAELHCHSAFSFLDGASLPEELVAAAVELGHDTLALTDHNTVSGSMEFAEAAAAFGLRAIHGAEIDLVEPDRAPGVRNHEV